MLVTGCKGVRAALLCLCIVPSCTARTIAEDGSRDREELDLQTICERHCVITRCEGGPVELCVAEDCPGPPERYDLTDGCWHILLDLWTCEAEMIPDCEAKMELEGEEDPCQEERDRHRANLDPCY